MATHTRTLRHSALRDTTIIAGRSLRRYIRMPQLLAFPLAQPLMILVGFNYVFGGALGSTVHIPGGKYIDFLLPGILVQMVMFGGVQTGIGLAEDMGKGIVDRFRSLPMSRLAVIGGRTLSDAVRNVIAIMLTLALGYVMGFRFQDGVVGAAAMVSLCVLFGYALSWAFAAVGMAVKDS